MDRQTLGEIARADTGRVEGLDDGENRRRLRRGRAQPGRDILDRFAQIAGLVDGVDDRPADEALARAGATERQLVGQIFVQALLRGDISLEIRRLAVRAAAARGPIPGGGGKPRPFQRLDGARWRDARPFRLEGVGNFRAQLRRQAGRIDRQPFPRPVAFARPLEGLGRVVADTACFAFQRDAPLRRDRIGSVRFEQRIALQFVAQKR